MLRPQQGNGNQDQAQEEVEENGNQEVDEAGFDGEFEGLFVIDCEPLAVVDEEQDSHHQDAQVSAFTKCDQQCQEHEDTELA